MTGLLCIILGLIGLTALLRLLAWLIHVPVASRVFGEMPWLPAEWCGPLDEGQDVEFPAADGVRLRGTYLPTPAPWRRGVIGFCHELNGDRWSALRYTQELRRRGFDVFTFDFRNHGSSDRVAGYEPLPWVTAHELSDVHGAVDYLCGRSDADPRGIGLLGISRGGTAALCAASQEPRVRALVVDGTIPTEQMQLHCARRFVKSLFHSARLASLLPDVVLSMLGAWAKLVLGWRCNGRFVNVEQAARRLRQPALLIHGHRDTYVPVEVVRAMRATMSPRCRLWVVPHAQHNRAIVAAAEKYQQRLLRFFGRHLAAPVPAEVRAPIGLAGRHVLPQRWAIVRPGHNGHPPR